MIAHVITNFDKKGGAEGLLIRHLLSSQVKDILLVSLMKISDEMAQQIPKSVKLVQLDSRNLITMFISALKLNRVLKDNGVTNLVCWMYHANVIGCLSKLFDRRVNIIWNVRHSLDDLPGEKFSTKLAIRLGLLLSWRASKVVFCAVRSMEQHIGIKYCNAEKAVYIPNGFIFDEKSENKKIHAKNKKKVIIGAMGRFHSSKDYETLFKALKIVQDAKYEFIIRLAGHDMVQDNQNLTALVKGNGIFSQNVEYFGFQKFVSEFYSEIDFFVLASKTEGFPNVLVEAAYSGCLCIASDAGDSARILSNKARIFPIRDFDKLAAILTKYFSSDGKTIEDNIKEDMRHVIGSFSISKFNSRLTELYK
jgi:glycosyltransferase involved in cell wall biosynthesis